MTFVAATQPDDGNSYSSKVTTERGSIKFPQKPCCVTPLTNVYNDDTLRYTPLSLDKQSQCGRDVSTVASLPDEDSLQTSNV